MFTVLVMGPPHGGNGRRRSHHPRQRLYVSLGRQCPLDQFTITSQARAFENVCSTVNVNQSTKMENTQSYQYSGDSCLVDFEGRILYQTTCNQGDNFLFSIIDLAALRAWRKKTIHHMGIGHIRTEAYSYLDKPLFPCQTIKKDEMYSLKQALPLNEDARKRIGWDKY